MSKKMGTPPFFSVPGEGFAIIQSYYDCPICSSKNDSNFKVYFYTTDRNEYELHLKEHELMIWLEHINMHKSHYTQHKE